MSVTYSPIRNKDNVIDEDTERAIANIFGNNTSKQPSATPTTPLLLNASAPLAKSELDDDLDSRDVATAPYPGIDDGFFNGNGTNRNKDDHPLVEDDAKHPKVPDSDVEIIPTKPKDPEPIEPVDDDVPTITDRFDPDGGTTVDENDGKHEEPKRPFSPHPSVHPHFPYAPGYGPDFEIGSIPGEIPESIPDVNMYQHKKTLAQGMMDLALFSANANQLRYVLESYKRHPYFYPSIIFISISLILQVAVGMGLMLNSRYNVKDDKEICRANKINNFTVIGIFVVTVINVFISAFGVANPA